MLYKRYNIILSVPIWLFFLAILGLAFVIEPLNGSLTRGGGYTEKDFGWNQPQETFQSKFYLTGRDGLFNKYHDVMVFGDSFTNYSPGEVMDPAGYWPNYFVNETGLNLIAFHLFDTNLIRLIDSVAFKKFPPRLFIYEVVERDAIKNLVKIKGDCKLKKSPQIKPFLIQPYEKALLTFERNTKTGISNLNFDESGHYLKKAFMKKVYHNFSNVFLMTLDHEGLFSNKLSKNILIIREDFNFKTYDEALIQNGVCGLINLQNKVQSNNKTIFIALIAPDKLSAYSNHIKSLPDKGKKIIDYFEKIPLNRPRIDLSLKEGINEGLMDVYLPNDTHWGSTGHKIVAHKIVEYLENRRILKRRKSSENLKNIPISNGMDTAFQRLSYKINPLNQ